MDWFTPEEVAEYRAKVEQKAEMYGRLAQLFRDADAGDPTALLIMRRNGLLQQPTLVASNPHPNKG